MKARAAVAALARPFAEPVLLLAALLFGLLLGAGLAIVTLLPGPLALPGLAVVLLIALPALAGYVLALVEARAFRRPLPVIGLELFLPGGKRRLLPLLPVAILAGLHVATSGHAAALATAATATLALLWLPGSTMLLAMTDSAAASCNPLAIARLYRRLWPGCLWFLPAIAVYGAILAPSLAASPLLALAVAVPSLLSLATLAGDLLATLDVAAETDIAPPATPDPTRLSAAVAREREAVLNHAYGLTSRGNRDGGFAHIAAQVAAEADPVAADLWFFHRLWRWDLGETPLFYGQALLGRLLAQGANREAMKVALRCLAASPRFAPREADRDALCAAAHELKHQEVLTAFCRPR